MIYIYTGGLNMIKILLVDDHRLLLDLLADTLNGEEDFNVVGKITDAKEAINFCETLKPDLIIMDIYTENSSNGISYGEKIKKIYPEIKIIIMTGVLDTNFINSARDANLDSFIYKNIEKKSLIASIRSTLDGYHIFPDTKISQSNILSKLTEPELKTLTEYCKVLNKDDVIKNLNISERTYRNHITSIYEKTGFKKIAPLAVYCISNGLIVPNL